MFLDNLDYDDLCVMLGRVQALKGYMDLKKDDDLMYVREIKSMLGIIEPEMVSVDTLKSTEKFLKDAEGENFRLVGELSEAEALVASLKEQITSMQERIAELEMAATRTEDPEIKEEPEGPGKDWNKAQALRNAGWTIKAIAEEIGCSPLTVSKHTTKPVEITGKNKELEGF